jgi:MFS family permease
MFLTPPISYNCQEVPVFSYSTATFPCSFLLGYVSDLKGRRPIMLLGLAGNILSSVAFGFSKSLWFALACRLVAGFLNGNTGVVKVLFDLHHLLFAIAKKFTLS